MAFPIGQNVSRLLRPSSCVVVQRQSVGVWRPIDYYAEYEDYDSGEENSTSTSRAQKFTNRYLKKYLKVKKNKRRP